MKSIAHEKKKIISIYNVSLLRMVIFHTRLRGIASEFMGFNPDPMGLSLSSGIEWDIIRNPIYDI